MSPVQLRRWWLGSYETNFQCISAVPGEPRGNPWEHLAVLSAKQELSRRWWMSTTRWTLQSLSLTKWSFPYLGKLMLRPQDKQSNLHVGEPPASKKGTSIRQTGNGLDKDRLSEIEMRMSWPCNFKAAKDSEHLYFEGFTLCIFCGKLQFSREKRKRNISHKHRSKISAVEISHSHLFRFCLESFCFAGSWDLCAQILALLNYAWL